MSLAGYRIFAEIVSSGSLAATARKLHLSPSAISKQLAQLEARLGTKLLYRSTRSMQVTEAGERFHQRCLQILEQVELAEAEARDIAGDIGGTLRLTVPAVMAGAELAGLLGRFTANYPGVSFDVEVSNDPQNLIDRRVDLGFRAGPLQDSRLVATELFRSHIVMAASPEYIDSFGLPLDTDGLAQHTLLMADPVYLQASDERSGLASRRFTPRQSICCQDLGMLLELARAGAGVAMLWDSCARPAFASGDLLRFDSVIPHRPRPLSLVYPSREYLPQRTRLFIEYVRSHYLQRQ